MWDAEFSRSELDFEQDRTRWTSTNWTPPPSLVIRVVHHDLLLMVQKSGIHQLRLVVFAIIHKVFYITGAGLGFLNHQWRISIHCHLYIASLETPNPFHGPNHVFVGNLRVSRHGHLTSTRQGFLFQWRQSPAGPLHEAAGGRRCGPHFPEHKGIMSWEVEI